MPTNLRTKLLRGYGKFSLIVANTFFLFLFLNVVALIAGWIFPRIRHNQDFRPVESRAWLLPENNDTPVSREFASFSQKSPIWRGYFQETEPVVSGEHLNTTTDELGFGFRRGGASNPDLLVFGGSTAFGYGVSDEETIPALISARNYAARNHSWFQELALLQRLIHEGARPKKVVFLDGPHFQSHGGANNTPTSLAQLRNLWDLGQYGLFRIDYPRFIPLLDWVNRYQELQQQRKLDQIVSLRYANPEPSSPSAIKASFIETLRLRRTVARAIGASASFFWMPHPAYHCDQNQLRRRESLREKVEEVVQVYEEMSRFQDHDFSFLAEACNHLSRESSSFVDGFHYSPALNSLLAREIRRKLEPQTGVIN